MDEIERIADQLARAYEGDPWWGPSTRDVVGGLTAAQAAHRPIEEAHSIWEIALHATSWNREVLRRLQSDVAREPADGDWPEAPEPSEESWRATVDGLEASYRELHAAIRAFPAERLEAILGDARDRPLGSGVSFYVLMHGAVQHLVAHTAQMSLLRKAAR